MTPQEAISTFKEWIERDKAMEYADRYENIEIYKTAIKALEQQPCDDCISREDAINVVHKYFVKYLKLNDDICLDGIRSLPSVTPKEESEDKGGKS